MFEFESLEASRDVCDALYERHFLTSQVSGSTSSHWRKYGDQIRVVREEKAYRVNGVGFGEYPEPSLLRHIFSFPSRIFVARMIAGTNPRIVAEAARIAATRKRIFSFDLARMVRTVDFLGKHVGLEGKRIAIIGDGYGTLGSLIKGVCPRATIFQVNLGKVLFFDALFSGLALPQLGHRLVNQRLDAGADFNYVEAERVSEVGLEGIDVFLNIASMQEMDLDVIHGYLDIMRGQQSPPLFYCCNREEKVLPDGSRIRFQEYGWNDGDEVLVDELCPWHQVFPRNRPPFFGRFDGPTRHRLVRLSQAD